MSAAKITVGGLGTKYGVWCRVPGGITGDREAWLKENGERVECNTREEAETIAASYNEATANRPGYSAAKFEYRAALIRGQQ